MEKREAEEFSKNILENSNKMNKNACVKSENYNSYYSSMVKSGTVLVKQGRLECLLIPTTTSRSVSASWALLNLFDLNLYFLSWNIKTYLRILLSLGIRQKTFFVPYFAGVSTFLGRTYFYPKKNGFTLFMYLELLSHINLSKSLL